jgi:hypothetical protein
MVSLIERMSTYCTYSPSDHAGLAEVKVLSVAVWDNTSDSHPLDNLKSNTANASRTTGRLGSDR